MATSLLLYAPKWTHRARYAWGLLLGTQLGITYTLTEDLEAFLSAPNDTPRLSYADIDAFSEIPFIRPAKLLFEKGIDEQSPIVERDEDLEDGLPFFFWTSRKGFLCFDIAAVAFYLVTRYEEYLPHHTDRFGRYHAHDSLAYQNGFLETALVDRWALVLLRKLQEIYPQLEHKPRRYKFRPTIDVDNSWAFLHKDLIRTAWGTYRDVQGGKWDLVKDRVKVLLRQKADPYFTYSYLRELHARYGLRPIHFFLVGNYGGFDTAHSPYSKPFQSLVKETADFFPVGMHPSFASHTNEQLFENEHSLLEGILHRHVVRSRQHYLQLRLPSTYQQLMTKGIREDYTMLYPMEPGFRASTAIPFMFYDLDLEQVSSLEIHPCVAMDGTFRHYLKLTPEEANERLAKLVEEVQAVNGQLVTVWHNDSVSEYDGWKGWRWVYESLIERATPEENRRRGQYHAGLPVYLMSGEEAE